MLLEVNIKLQAFRWYIGILYSLQWNVLPLLYHVMCIWINMQTVVD